MLILEVISEYSRVVSYPSFEGQSEPNASVGPVGIPCIEVRNHSGLAFGYDFNEVLLRS